MARPFDLISFDFDGVLLHSNHWELFLDACRDLGFSWSQECERRLARYLFDYYGSGQSIKDRAEYGEEHHWRVANRRFLTVLEVEGDLDAAATTLIERMQGAEVLYHHEYGVHDMLASLREQGYRLAMLTNRDERIREFGAEWDMIDLFEFIGTRETVGRPKPEPHVYRHIAEYFQVTPDRALHIGDNPYADVVGAQAAGWHALLLDPDNHFPDWDVPRIPTLRDLPGWLAEQGAGSRDREA